MRLLYQYLNHTKIQPKNTNILYKNIDAKILNKITCCEGVNPDIINNTLLYCRQEHNTTIL